MKLPKRNRTSPALVALLCFSWEVSLSVLCLVNIASRLNVLECCCWATCTGWSSLHTPAVVSGKPVSTRCYAALTTPLLCLLRFPFSSHTLTSLLSDCQRLPSVGVRHGVRVPGCQLLPAHTVTSSSAASASCANATVGHYCAFILSWLLMWVEEAFYVAWAGLNCSMYFREVHAEGSTSIYKERRMCFNVALFPPQFSFAAAVAHFKCL